MFRLLLVFLLTTSIAEAGSGFLVWGLLVEWHGDYAVLDQGGSRVQVPRALLPKGTKRFRIVQVPLTGEQRSLLRAIGVTAGR